MGKPAVAKRVRVRGDVQGVFFRDSTRKRAHDAGLTGWVRNCADGAVEAHLEGDAGSVAEVLEWMRGGGPPAAHVVEVDVDEREAEGHERFEVRR